MHVFITLKRNRCLSKDRFVFKIVKIFDYIKSSLIKLLNVIDSGLNQLSIAFEWLSDAIFDSAWAIPVVPI